MATATAMIVSTMSSAPNDDTDGRDNDDGLSLSLSLSSTLSLSLFLSLSLSLSLSLFASFSLRLPLPSAHSLLVSLSHRLSAGNSQSAAVFLRGAWAWPVILGTC